MKKAYLHLQNGKIFEGEAFGAETEATGELVFTTGMTGYIETLTDPSYYGQIAVSTFPLIGNYGIIESDFESEKCHMRAYVVRDWCKTPSNFRSQYDIDAFLKAQNVPGLCGVDTRELTTIIRENGVMNARLTYSPDPVYKLDDYSVKNAVAAVTMQEKYIAHAENPRLSVALIDYGAKHNIIARLNGLGADVTVYPPFTTADEILSGGHAGVVLSNGPGDPAENTVCIRELSRLFGKLPIFGVCLGHQLLALATGARTEKLKYGHRGANQPVTDVTAAGRTFITSQNHGYAVSADSIKTGVIRYINANDGTCEGIDYPEQNSFTVQFHPEACAGPRDTASLFDRYISMIGGAHNAD